MVIPLTPASKASAQRVHGNGGALVVNLDQSSFSEADVRKHLARTAPSGLKEVLVVKDETVNRVWP